MVRAILCLEGHQGTCSYPKSVLLIVGTLVSARLLGPIGVLLLYLDLLGPILGLFRETRLLLKDYMSQHPTLSRLQALLTKAI